MTLTYPAGTQPVLTAEIFPCDDDEGVTNPRRYEWKVTARPSKDGIESVVNFGYAVAPQTAFLKANRHAMNFLHALANSKPVRDHINAVQIQPSKDEEGRWDWHHFVDGLGVTCGTSDTFDEAYNQGYEAMFEALGEDV